MMVAADDTVQAPAQVRGTMAHVNLLPPEISQGRRFRRVQTGLAGGVALAIALVALGFLLAAAAVGNANTRLQSAQAAQAGVQKETSGYAGVTNAYTRTAAVQTMLSQAMAKEVRYSQFLTVLSESMPSNVVLNNLAFTETAVAAGGAAAAPAAGAAGAAPAAGAAGAAATAGGVGTVTMSGVAASYEDVARWLEAVVTQKGYGIPVLQSTTEALANGSKIVNWSTTVALTPVALSGRYTKVGG